MVTFTYTIREFKAAVDSSEGRCIGCGDFACETEPDAENRYCDNCGHDAVYGVEHLLLMGVIILTG